MKRLRILAAIPLTAGLSAGLLSCAETKKATCAGDVICTQMFVSLNVQVTSTSGATLDSVVTIREDKAGRFSGSGADGNYVVLDDSYLNDLKMTTGRFTLKGYKAGQVVINEPYTISADCCHIMLKSGKKELTIP